MEHQQCYLKYVLFAALASPILLGGGCPGPPVQQNTAAVANAGPDQNVAGGSSVNLNGSASTDPDGDTLTFSWTQTAGTAVVLNNAATATPSFVAPNTTETLTFQLTAADPVGLSNTDSVNVNVTAQLQNLPPVANAGTDQTVSTGSTVNLNGSASTDPDGDTLTFAWTQTLGTSVTLTSAATATPSFTAPGTEETLTFQLTVNDGNGNTDSDSVNVTVTQNPVLFIANFNGDNVVGYDISDPQSVNGNIAPDANLAGAQTLLSRPSDIIVNSAGALMVSNFDFGNASITSYDNAADLSAINGNVVPQGNVQGAATLLVQPTSLAANTASDLIFVAEIITDQILIFANASASSFNGNLAPTRIITSADLNNPFGINFGANGNLYVANNGAGNVVVFANASNLNGNVAATRTITSATFTNPFDVFVDSNDRMFVVNASPANTIDVFNNASTLNGAVTPSVTLQVQGAGSLTAIAVDSSGSGYIIDNTGNAMYGYNNIATRNGLLPPDRTLQGANTQLVGPIRVFLLE